MPDKNTFHPRAPPAGTTPQTVAPVHEHQGEHFSGSISVDGNRYRNCFFDECVMTYGGGMPPSFSDCRFRNSRMSFVGAAANTLMFLKAMDSPRSGLQRVLRETFRGFTSS